MVTNDRVTLDTILDEAAALAGGPDGDLLAAIDEVARRHWSDGDLQAQRMAHEGRKAMSRLLLQRWPPKPVD